MISGTKGGCPRLVRQDEIKVRIALLLLALCVLWYTAESARVQRDSPVTSRLLMAQAHPSSNDRRPPITLDGIQTLMRKYTDRWNADPNKPPLWVVAAKPGDRVQIPGITFGKVQDLIAGMELPIRAQLIVINQAMVPESKLTTFLHEYGHSLYRHSTPGEPNETDSEAEAIRFSLAALDAEELGYLAHREAEAVKRMASREPYKSAVKKLTPDPMWRKYSHEE